MQNDASSSLPDAYSRCSNRERFAPLHAYAERAVARLASGYDVEVSSSSVRSVGLGPASFVATRDPLTVTPRSPKASRLSFEFSSFPGLLVHYGRWHVASFPSCGCDACDEQFETEAIRLDELIGHVVAGRLLEELRRPWLGEAWLSESFIGTATWGFPGAGSGGVAPPALARSIRRGRVERVRWEPWAASGPAGLIARG